MNNRIIKYRDILPNISDKALIADNATITGDVTIGKNTNIWYGCVIRGDVAPIKIGSGTNVQDNSVIHVSRANHPTNKTGNLIAPTIIGKGVTIGHKALIHAATIDDYCFIGMGSIIMDLVHIEHEAMIAAGAVVTPKRHIKYGEIYAGNPAKLLRKMSEEEIRYIKTSEQNYIELALEYFSYYNSK
ncbi:MAG: gamma carbonic anhydrase family protein [Rickettsiales bacterium]|jgi:gamma-carbonic anhydrase|nr:gamma carbonic anhydrase family protein [Rickettsiales bacterium]